MKKSFTFFVLVLLLSLPLYKISAQTYPLKQTQTTTITSTSTSTWTVPAGALKITKVECWGAGGSGGSTNARMGAGGGGGGAYAAYNSDITTIPGSTFNIHVGAGGTGGNGGGNTYFSSSNEASAYAAAGGGKSPGTSTTGADGGTVNKGTGNQGGKGGNGTSSSKYGSGGGGGAAGPSSAGGAGGNGTTSAAGAAGQGHTGVSSHSGNGGAGRYNSAGNGNDGSDYGGGGGGACRTGIMSSNKTGGDGANGAIIITYETLTLLVTRDLNYEGAPDDGSFTIPYYNNYTNDNLTAPTRDGYVFLGWTTSQNGHDYLSTSNQCQNTDNYTIYAQWLYTGSISGVTNISPCALFAVENQVPANISNDVNFTYNWYLKKNGTLTGDSFESNAPTLASGSFTATNPDIYSVVRYVKIGSNEYASNGEYHIEVTFNSGNIEDIDTTIAPGTPISINGSEVSNSEYFWTHNGDIVPGATNQNLSIAENTLCSGNHTYLRYAKTNGCAMDSIASENEYLITVADVQPGKISSSDIYTCLAGSFSVQNVTEASITPNKTISYKWTYTKDGGEETAIANSDVASLDNSLLDIQTLGAGTYILKRYAKVACSDWFVSEGSATIYAVELPSKYDAPTPNYDEFCVGGKVLISKGNWHLDESLGFYATPSEYHWMIAQNADPAALVSNNENLSQELTAEGLYTIGVDLFYFNQTVCKVSTDPIQVTVVADPTLTAPTVSTASICPSNEVTLTSQSIENGIQAGAGSTFNYTWEFKDEVSDWDTISANEASYDTYHNNVILASNYKTTGDLQYRVYVSNDRGCDVYSDPVNLNVISLAVPIVRGDTTVCPETGKTISFKATATDPSFSLRWYETETSSNYVTSTPSVSMDYELDTTNYVAQYNPEDGCVSARVPDAIYITYSAHLQYVDASGDLIQTVCQNDVVEDILFYHGGDCEPLITFSPYMPDGITIDNSIAGETRITGAPAVAGTFTYHVALLPNENTKCAAPNSFDGTITVHPTYNITDVQSLCAGNSYTVSDQHGTSHTYNTTGVYIIDDLKSVNGCDSIVTLDLYIQEWNQFGFEENETLLAGWTSFSNVSSPISADVNGSMPGSTISYSDWNGSNITSDNLSSSSSLIPASGNSLGLINGVMEGSLFSPDLRMNNGKNIIIHTSTKDYANIKLRFDYGIERLTTGDNDHGFTNLTFAYSTDNVTYHSCATKMITMEGSDRVDGSYELNLSEKSSKAIDDNNDLYIKITFDGAAKSTFGYLSEWTKYSLLDNICISGHKAIDEITISAETIVCTNQGSALMATPPYVNTDVTPNETTPVNYNWERIHNGVSTLLDAHDYYLTDEDDIPTGDFQYVVSVGNGTCIVSDTLDMVGIAPAYRLDIERHGYVCANEVDQVSNITFTDECEYIPGMFIITPKADEMRQPGLYECQLSIPSESNPCDSVITLWLDVRKAFDTTIVAYICLGESYTDYGFNFTPTEEGVEYLTSPADWQCSTGCDSVYRVTLITNSVQQILSSESNVTLVAWDMNTGTNNFQPTCGIRTSGANFSVYNTSEFNNVTGYAPSSDYCYSTDGANGALQWANLSSTCSGFLNEPSYTYYDGVYFEIKLVPENYNNLNLKFDYKRDNNNGGAAFNNVNYSYKFAASDSYTYLGSKTINGTSWSTAEFDLSSLSSLNEDELFIKLEFTGGSAGNTQSCGTLKGSKYLPSYITIDNLMVSGDRPALTTLDATAQTCNASYVCEGTDVTFTCQGDDDYLKFFLVNETTSEETPFNGTTELTITPDATADYTIKAVDQITHCDSSWTFHVEVVKMPVITLTRGSLDLGICGNTMIDNEFVISNAVSYTLTWLTDGNVIPAGVVIDNEREDTISLSGTLSDDLFARYLVEAEPDTRCASTPLQKIGLITMRKQPIWIQTIGTDTVCQGTDMQFKLDTTALNFALVPEANRVIWSTEDGPIISSTDTSFFTLDYMADETTHSKMHYLTVNQNGCTTVDSFNIVVYNLTDDNLECTSASYNVNFGEPFLHADSLVVPPVIHNGDTLPNTMISSVLYRRTNMEDWHLPTDSVFIPSTDNPNTTIYWQVTDVCGNTHECSQNIMLNLPPCGEGELSVTDYDGNEYSTVRIGFNCWLKQNLKSTHYSDGEPIPNARPYYATNNSDTTQNALVFGRLYSWYDAARIPQGTTTPSTSPIQGACPEGWYLPTEEQFNTLVYIDALTLRSPDYWLLNPGTNETDFSMLPSGFYNDAKARCENLLGRAYFWTCDETNNTIAKSFMADCNCYMLQEILSSKSLGYSVRCVKGK